MHTICKNHLTVAVRNIGFEVPNLEASDTLLFAMDEVASQTERCLGCSAVATILSGAALVPH